LRHTICTQMPPCLGTREDATAIQLCGTVLPGSSRVCATKPGKSSDMRNLVLSASAVLLLSTGLAFAQGSGAAGDIGSGAVPRATSPTVGQSAAEPATPAPAPKAAKKTAKKKK
jgi:hypothetical protein